VFWNSSIRLCFTQWLLCNKIIFKQKCRF